MEHMIFPEIFDGYVMGFFTDRELGIDVRGLCGRRVYFPRQVHSADVCIVGEKLDECAGDAVITNRRDIMLGIKAADCVPILLYDRVGHAIGAVHAGWRGTAKGILKNTIAKMNEAYGTYPPDLLLAIGPSVKGCCYEVGEDVAEAVRKTTGDGEIVLRMDGRFMLDLQKASMYQALSMGVAPEAISITEECTSCNPEVYYSYRREPGIEGRQGGFIGLP